VLVATVNEPRETVWTPNNVVDVTSTHGDERTSQRPPRTCPVDRWVVMKKEEKKKHAEKRFKTVCGEPF
jgi:hypothetical protein